MLFRWYFTYKTAYVQPPTADEREEANLRYYQYRYLDNDIAHADKHAASIITRCILRERRKKYSLQLQYDRR